MAAELSDAEVFGKSAEMTDAQVFGMPPPTTVQAAGRGFGLGVRDVIEGTLGGPYDLIAKGINATGFLPPINTLGENLTKLGLPEPQTPFERTVSAIDQPIASTLVPMGIGRTLLPTAGTAVRAADEALPATLPSSQPGPIAQAAGEALTAQPVVQGVAAGAGGATTAATGDPRYGMAVSLATPLAAGAAGMAGRALENSVIGGISKPDAELGQLALSKYNIPIGAPDLTDNTLIRIGADQAGKLPFSGARPAAAAKQAAWQGAIANEMGEPGSTSFTPDVMNAAKSRIGQVFNDAAASTSIPPDETSVLSQGLAKILPDASQVLTEAELKPLALQIDNINSLIAKGNGTLSGDAYQALTRAKAPLDLAESSTNPNVAHYAGMIRDELEDAFQRSAPPEVRDALSQARYQYRIMRTIDPLVAGSRDGNITPDAFMQKVLTASRRFDSPTGGMAYTGGGNIGELARIGKLMRAAPQTGTADRMLVNLMAAGGTGAIGALAANPSMALTVPAGLVANRLAGSYLRSGAAANRLIQAALPDAGRPNPLMDAFHTSGVTALANQYQNPLLMR
jgi:hypothetical protein